MAVTLFFGIRLSGRPYERIAHKLDEDAYSTYKVDSLKKLLVGGLLGNYSDASGLGKVIFHIRHKERTLFALTCLFDLITLLLS